jgi:hypothetical protein
MLSFEWSKNDECLEVHADEAGLTRLARVIEFLKSTQTPDHIHLMSEKWGGDELSSTLQGLDNRLVHHVKVFRWKTNDNSSRPPNS